MKTVLVTGSGGFLGMNLVPVLSERDDICVLKYEADDPREALDNALCIADVVVHLAGVNRPENVDGFMIGNAEFTRSICDVLRRANRSTKVIMSSSIQAELNNLYGTSKRLAEEELKRYAAESGAEAVAFRFKNIFGKWARPNYNSVVATFCHNMARDLPISIADPDMELELVFVNDVVAAIMEEVDGKSTASPGFRFGREIVGHTVRLGQLAEIIRSFRNTRMTCLLPDFSDQFTGRLYATYLSYLDDGDLGYDLEQKTDSRGALAEFIKSPHIGQVFTSRTRPGITRGNHYHHTKVEKFLVAEGTGVIRLRHLKTERIVEMKVSGEDFRVVDVPPGYTHSIENVGTTDLVVIFWASEIFDPNRPDTYYREVTP